MGSPKNERKDSQLEELLSMRTELFDRLVREAEAEISAKYRNTADGSKTVQIDETPKSTDSSETHRATQVDEGWRNRDTSERRQATQVDEGWRNRDTSERRQATQVDEGWRSRDTSEKRQATQVDEGWRNRDASGKRQATQVDEGWRNEVSSNVRQAVNTQTDWRNTVADILNSTTTATENYFATIKEFKDTVARLPQLTTSTNTIYQVKKTISTEGGESIILLCSGPDGNDVVAKVYYEPANSAGSSLSARVRVLEYMATEEGQKYTLAVSEIGVVEFGDSKYYFEITPYIPGGDISHDGALSFEKIRTLTKQMNEILHSIHQAGIIHRDIKPENLYEIDGQIKLGDFGIARDGVVGRSKATELIAGTEGYTAPETKRYIYSAKSDYYSLGVTLATLFEGHYVFENMDFDMQALAQESEKLPLLRLDPQREQLENLLNGLCRISAKQRFGYEDVNRWLADHNYTGGGDEEEWPKSFHLLGKAYHDERSLFMGITQDEEHWNEGKEMLYRKYFENFFKSFRTDLARAAQTAEETYRTTDRDKGLAIFLKSLFAPGHIVWKGYSFSSLQELGNKMVAAKSPAAYGELLQKNIISHWLAHTEGVKADNDTMKLVIDIEDLSVTEPELACYWFGNSFASKKSLNICNKNVSTIEGLIKALFASPKDFYQTDGCKKLLSRTDGADLYGFLFSFGYKEAVEKEWERLNKCDTFNKITILISLIDNIAVKASVDPAIIRKFFVDYGPIGFATYTKKLVDKTDDKVYMALDSNGKQLLSKISGFKAPASGSVNELFRAYTPLVENVEQLRRNLTDNPHCILAGVYTSKGVICCNLVGCFAYKIFDRVAPLGFNAWIESAKGGTK